MDTHYDPNPETSHDQITEVDSAGEVLAGVLATKAPTWRRTT